MGLLPGVRPLPNYRGWKRVGHQAKKTIEEKRESVVKGIERALRGEKGAQRFEQFDHEHGTPVIRVLYANQALPIFDGQTTAAIDPTCDRAELWRAVIEQIRAGDFDREIEQAASNAYQSLRQKRQAPPRAA